MAFTIKQTPKTEKFNFSNVDTNIEASKVGMTIDGLHCSYQSEKIMLNFSIYVAVLYLVVN
jgi:hypothetical protein